MMLSKKKTLLCGLILTVVVSGCASTTTVSKEVAVEKERIEEVEKENTEQAVDNAAAEAPAEEPAIAEANAQRSVAAASNNVQSATIQVTDSGIGSLTASTPFSVEAVQSAFPAMDVTTTTQSAEGVEYPVIVVSDGSAEVMRIEPTADESLFYRVKVTGTQFESASGHKVGDAFSSVYGGSSVPDSCVTGVDAASDFVLCTAPSSQSVQYAFAGGWDYAYGVLPAETDLSSGVIEEIVWLPGNY